MVVGGSGGIGSQLVTSLSSNNEVFAVGRDEEKLNNLKNKLNCKNVRVLTMDVSRVDQIKKLFKVTERLDVLINCAAVLSPIGLFLDNKLSDWKKNIEINLLGTVNCCYYALPLLLESERGKIINFGGGGAAYGRAGHTAYASSKTAVVRFTETLATEYPTVDINVIAPGAYKTKMWNDETFEKGPESWGDMETLKEFIGFLVSDKSDGLTGRFLHYKDDWKNMNGKKLKDFMFTLRRIDNFMFTKKR